MNGTESRKANAARHPQRRRMAAYKNNGGQNREETASSHPRKKAKQIIICIAETIGWVVNFKIKKLVAMMDYWPVHRIF